MGAVVLPYTCDLLVGWGRMGSSDALAGWLGKDGVFGCTCWLVGGICCPYRGGVRSGLHTFSGGAGRSGPSCWGGEGLRTIVTVTVRRMGC